MKSVAFDMIGVIVLEEKIVSRRLYDMLPDPLVPREELKRRYDEGLSIGRMTEDDFWDGVVSSDWHIVREKFIRSLATNNEIIDLIKLLKSRNRYKLGLLSDMWGAWGRDLLELRGLRGCFDVQVYSSDVGLKKSEISIYEYIPRGLGLNPSEILYIDDRLKNVKMASSRGFIAALYDRDEISTEKDVTVVRSPADILTMAERES